MAAAAITISAFGSMRRVNANFFEKITSLQPGFLGDWQALTSMSGSQPINVLEKGKCRW
jgi:hypothetical protein